jgi:hypothetical protein
MNVRSTDLYSFFASFEGFPHTPAGVEGASPGIYLVIIIV